MTLIGGGGITLKLLILQNKIKFQGLGCNPMVEHLPGTYKVLDSIFSTVKHTYICTAHKITLLHDIINPIRTPIKILIEVLKLKI